MKKLLATVLMLSATGALADGCPNLDGRYENNAGQGFLILQSGCDSIRISDMESAKAEIITWFLSLKGDTKKLPTKYVDFITKSNPELRAAERDLKSAVVTSRLRQTNTDTYTDTYTADLQAASDIKLLSSAIEYFQFRVKVDAVSNIEMWGSSVHSIQLEVTKITFESLQPNSLVGAATQPVLNALNFLANQKIILKNLRDVLRPR